MSSVKKHQDKIISFVICLIMILYVELGFYGENWTYDAYDYWNRGEEILNNGFSLKGIDGFRGYVYPFYLAVVNAIGGKIAWFAINAILTAFFVMLLSYLFDGVDKDIKHVVLKNMIVCVLLIILFRGVIVYPLADLFAAVLCSLSAVCLKMSMNKEKIQRLLCFFCTGMFIYMGYNVRTIYLFAGMGFILAFIILYLLKKKKGIIVGLLTMFLGGFSAAIPQFVMNYINQGIISAKVPTNNLMLTQMYWGLQWQRYDTYVPNVIDISHPNPQVYFLDLLGQAILEKSQTAYFTSWADYIDLFLRYPIEIISIYVKHFVNMLFPCWPDIYVKDLYSSKFLLGILAITLIFLIVLGGCFKCFKEKESIYYVCPMIIPAIMIIPGAVEYRFSLPIYIFMIGMLCYNTDWTKMLLYIKKSKVVIIFSYIVLCLLCFSLWSNMLASESVLKLLF